VEPRFFGGFLRKRVFCAWFFGGENVVERVTNVVLRSTLFLAESLPLFENISVENPVSG
jgi:hypothetical protein